MTSLKYIFAFLQKARNWSGAHPPSVQWGPGKNRMWQRFRTISALHLHASIIGHEQVYFLMR